VAVVSASTLGARFPPRSSFFLNFVSAAHVDEEALECLPRRALILPLPAATARRRRGRGAEVDFGDSNELPAVLFFVTSLPRSSTAGSGEKKKTKGEGKKKKGLGQLAQPASQRQPTIAYGPTPFALSTSCLSQLVSLPQSPRRRTWGCGWWSREEG
jgi:hypothetical protein